jgi:RNA polymerase sigma-70 factor, ECF subfamily
MSGHVFSDQFVDLVTPFQGQLLGYLYAILRNHQDAEDVLQQTYMELWRKFDQYDPQRSFFGWAREIARFQALTFVRQSRRDRLQFGSALIELLAEEMLATPQQYEQESARLRSLRLCIGQLKLSDRRLLRQCYRGRQTFREVAEKIGRSPQSVTNSLRRIRAALMECIQRTLAAEERA